MKLNVTKWKEKVDTEYSEDGLIRKNTLKPLYGSMILTAEEITIKDGFVNSRKKIGFITGKYDELVTMITKYGLIEGTNFSVAVAPHRIVVLERVESELNGELGFTEKINPSTKQILSKDGEPIYRKTEVVEEGSDIVDILISHDKDTEVTDTGLKEFATDKNVIAQL
jgi:hypothetical protein